MARKTAVWLAIAGVLAILFSPGLSFVPFSTLSSWGTAGVLLVVFAIAMVVFSEDDDDD